VEAVVISARTADTWRAVSLRRALMVKEQTRDMVMENFEGETAKKRKNRVAGRSARSTAKRRDLFRARAPDRVNQLQLHSRRHSSASRRLTVTSGPSQTKAPRIAAALLSALVRCARNGRKAS